METSIEVYATGSCAGREVYRAWLREAGEVYLVEQLDPSEEAPTHSRLVAAGHTLLWDEQSYWLLPGPGGAALADLLRSTRIAGDGTRCCPGNGCGPAHT